MVALAKASKVCLHLWFPAQAGKPSKDGIPSRDGAHPSSISSRRRHADRRRLSLQRSRISFARSEKVENPTHTSGLCGFSYCCPHLFCSFLFSLFYFTVSSSSLRKFWYLSGACCLLISLTCLELATLAGISLA